MAKSGYKDFTVASYIKIRFSWTAGTQNIANNFTPINWTLSLISTNSSANISSSVSKDYSVTVDGATKSGTNTVGLSGGATKILATGSKNIYHDATGKKTFNYSFSQEIAITYSGTYIGTITGSGSGELDDIPRGSVLGSISNFTIGAAMTIPITKYLSSYSDTLNIYVGNTWIKRVEGLTNNQSVSFTTAELTNIYKAMPNVASATFRFVNTTYNGANIVGTSTKTATGTITASIKPSISGVSLSEANTNVPSSWGLFVKGVSKILGTITASAGNGSSIANYSTSINGTRYTTQKFTTEALNTSGTNTVNVTVTDTRGRTATYSTTFSVVDYEKPYITLFKLTRKTATTATLRIVGGVYAINNKNTYSYKYKYKKKTDTNYTEVAITNNAYTIDKTIELTGLEDVTYDFVGIITDKFDEFPKESTLPTTRKIFNVKPDGNGFAFFKKSEKNALEIAKPIYDRFDTLINNGLSLYKAGGTDINPNTTLEELILTETNTPSGGFWYIRTMFYSTKSETSNRTQVAYPYAYSDVTIKGTIYTRVYTSGIGWSDWMATDIVSFYHSDGSGSVQFANGLLIQWGRVSITPSAANTVTSVIVNFPIAYDEVPKVNADPNVSYPNIVTSSVGGGTTTESSKKSMVIYMTRTNTVATTFQWLAVGYKKVVS